MKHIVRISCLVAGLSAWTISAEAIPVLQLDMANGVYDVTTETIVAPGGDFTLYAILTPQTNASPSELAALLAETYYISVALSPDYGPAPGNLGTFTFGQTGTTLTTVSATGDGAGGNLDMTYGTPPLETYFYTQGSDPNDLSKHGVYPTYFAEFAFQFDPTQTITAYNTQYPGDPVANPAGTAYVISFSGNSSLLAAGYALHFDLYSTALKDCATKQVLTCTDVDIDDFAPFSHDAGLTQVPEPATMLLLGTGLVLAPFARRRYASKR